MPRLDGPRQTTGNSTHLSPKHRGAFFSRLLIPITDGVRAPTPFRKV